MKGIGEQRNERALIGTSPAIRAALDRAMRVARHTIPVLLQGESGTGKELLARYIHDRSTRALRPFVAVNCAAIPKDLLEAELFGSERGAFTGAVGTRMGAFERADGGTLFLDEIGDLALEHQAKLLRATETGEIQRVGGAMRRVDVRLLAATHRDLRARSAAGEFREDLYHRLARFEIDLPPLRERGHDVTNIARAIVARDFPEKQLSTGALRVLESYVWPGNVRELVNVLGQAVIEARGKKRIQPEHLARRLRPADLLAPPAEPDALVRHLLAERGRLTAADLQRALGMGKTSTFRVVRDLVERGILVVLGKGRGAFYVAPSSLGNAQPA